MGVRRAIGESLRLLSKADRRKLMLVTAAQVATSILDLVGVLILGLVGALAVTTVQSEPPPSMVADLIDRAGLADLSDQQVLAVLALLAAGILLAKSIISSWLLRRVFRFLAGRQATVSARLTRLLLAQPLTFVLQRSSQETSYALVQGVGAATLVILGQGVVIVSELALLALLGLALLVVSPLVAIGSIVFFALIALGLQLGLGNWAGRSGRTMADADISSLDSIQEVLGAYREVTVANRRFFYTERVENLRWKAAAAAADLQFIFAFPKYLFEAALVVGGFALAGVLFSTQDSVVAVGTLTLFLAAATRVMPSILRLQGAALTLRNASGLAAPTLDLAFALGKQPSRSESTSPGSAMVSSAAGQYDGFEPSVELQDVSFAYRDADEPAIQHLSLSVPAGASIAFVGRSGAGKTTLADLVLGVLEPSSGRVLIGTHRPALALEQWPGAIAYVPQDVMLANASIRSNVALGLPANCIDDERVWEALERARLRDTVRSQPDGLDTVIGERGVKLSGGQRQRLGIARALYSRPRLLVLDEATSSLDAETEAAISQTLSDLEGVVTTFIIAHRLATVRGADQVVYLDQGESLAVGTFDEVRREVPAFDRQASILGLT